MSCITSSGRWIYRGTERDRALDYVIHGDTRYITTSRPGDFHPNRNEPTAYFTTRERYAHQLARGRDGLVIQQRVPRDLITSSRAHEFDPEPSSDWRTVSYHYQTSSNPQITDPFHR